MAARALPIIGEGGLSRYLAEIRKFPLLDPQEEYMLAKRWREHEDTEAAHRLLPRQLRLGGQKAMGRPGSRASTQEYILRSWSLVKLGTTAAQKKLFFNLRRVKGQIEALEEGDMRPEHVKDIAKRLGVPEQEVVNMNRRLPSMLPLLKTP